MRKMRFTFISGLAINNISGLLMQSLVLLLLNESHIRSTFCEVIKMVNRPSDFIRTSSNLFQSHFHTHFINCINTSDALTVSARIEPCTRIATGKEVILLVQHILLSPLRSFKLILPFSRPTGSLPSPDQSVTVVSKKISWLAPFFHHRPARTSTTCIFVRIAVYTRR